MDDQGNEPATPRRRVEPGSLADVGSIGDRLAADAIAGMSISYWGLVPVEDVFLIAAMDDVVSPSAGFELVSSYLGHLVETGDYSAATVEKVATLLARFVRYLDARYEIEDIRDVEQCHALEFVGAPSLGDELRVPRERTKANRRWALDVFFRTLRGLDLYDGDPLLDVQREVREAVNSRPLLDTEIERCRKHSPARWGDTLGPVRLALAEAMAATSESAAVVVSDYDAETSRLWLPGSPSRLRGRWVPLLPAQIESIEQRLSDIGASHPLTPLARDPSKPERAETICVALRKNLARAGLTLRVDPRVRPSSIRAWGARRLYDETGDLEEVRRCLGVRNLDTARRIIGLAPPDPEVPPSHRRPR